MRKRIISIVSSIVLVAAAVIGFGVNLGRPSILNSALTSGSPYAPYVDATLWPLANLSSISQASGIKSFTMAFITSYNGTQCNAAWGGYYPVSGGTEDSNISSFLSSGGSLIISFGGEAGTNLAETCTSASALEQQYQAVVDRYHVYSLDFDVEGAALNNTASINLRNQALAMLIANEAALGHQLTISYTLPVLPSGLLSNSLYLLNSAIRYQVPVSLVNIMTMDYGDGAAPSPAGQMGTYAIDALKATHAQLATLYPSKSASQIWAMQGATPMIGQNDISDEVFGLSDASQLTSFAESVGLGRLASWSANRDFQCSTNMGTTVSNTCSGVAEPSYGFASIFMGGSSGSTTSTTSATTSSTTTTSATTSSTSTTDPPISTSSTTDPPISTTSSGVALSAGFSVSSTWWGGYSGIVTITNKTSSTIQAWQAGFTLASGTTVTNSWNAVEEASSTGGYLFGNAGWNGQLAPGASTSFGFTVSSGSKKAGKPSGIFATGWTSSTTSPTSTTSTTSTTTTTDPPLSTTSSGVALSAGFSVSSTWWGGYSGIVTITNKTSSTIQAWQAGFTLPSGTTVTNSWNAVEKASSTGGYLFGNAGWNGQLAPGASTSFGFTVSSTSKVAPAPSGFFATGTA